MASSPSVTDDLKPKKRNFLIVVGLLFILSIISIVFMASEQMVTVQGSSINVRSGPGLSYDLVSEISPETRLHVVDRKGEWLKVISETDQVGWTPSWLFNQGQKSSGQSAEAVVSQSEANLYSQADTSSDLVATLDAGDSVEVHYQVGSWLQVESGDQKGWMSAYQVLISDQDDSSQETPEATVTILDVETNVRNQPTTESEKIGSAPAYASYPYLGSDGDWHMIQFDDDTVGFVADYLVEVDGVQGLEDNQHPVDRDIPALSDATIVLDAGHGGNDPGALGDAVYEKEVTLSTVRKLADLLEAQGANVILTREDDSYVYLSDRLADSLNSHADVFISIHYDASGVPNSMSGTTTYYFHDNDLELAQLVNHYLSANGPLSNNGSHIGDYYVLRNNARASLLLELGYMNHEDDYEYIETEEYHQEIAEAIYQALVEYFN